MRFEEKQAFVLTILERAADQLGDITPPLFELYYSRCPDAHLHFAAHQSDGDMRLEGAMAEQALYCVMSWFESPLEVEILLASTIPHHAVTLGVPEWMFLQLFEAVIEILESTIPVDAKQEWAVWRELCGGLIDLCVR